MRWLTEILNQHSYIFVRDLAVLDQLTRLAWPPPLATAAQLQADLVKSLTAHSKWVQSLALLTRRLFRASWKRLIPEPALRSDRMAERVHSWMSVILGNAGPGSMRLPMYKAQVFLAPLAYKEQLGPFLTHHLISVPAMPLETRRMLARLLRAEHQLHPAPSPPDDDSVTVRPEDQLPGSEEEVEILAEKGARTNENVAREVVRLCSRKDSAKSSIGDAAAATTLIAGAESEQNQVSATADTPVTLPVSSGISVQPASSPVKTADRVTAGDGSFAIPPPPGGESTMGSFIDEIVEECLMADETYRQEVLSTNPGVGGEPMADESASIKRLDLGESSALPAPDVGKSGQPVRLGKRLDLLSSSKPEQPPSKRKRLVVEPDDDTRLTCLILPPPPSSRPPYKVR